MKKVVFIAFYDKVCISIRTLSSVVKKQGHEPHLIYFKNDRTVIMDSFKKNSKYYQLILNNEFIGCGEDVNPPTNLELLHLLPYKIREINPDIICISARSVALDLTHRVVRELRKSLPDVLYIGGGYGPTIEPEAFLESLDFVCLGEGEQAMAELLVTDNPKQVTNMAWLDNGVLKHNQLAKPMPLDEILYPDWDFEDKYYIEDNKITPMKDAYDTSTYDIFTSRGCPSNCSYCMASHWDTMYSKYNGSMPKIRLRSVKSVIEELVIAKEKYDIQYVRFMDSIMGFNRAWLFNFLDAYDKKIGLKFFCQLDERFIDAERIKRLGESGLNFTTVGIQSANEQVRHEIMERNISDDELVAYAELLRDNNIRIKYDIIGWNPFETSKTLRQGVSFLKRLPKGEGTVVFQLTMFTGCPITSLAQEVKPHRLSDKEYEYWAWIYQMIVRSKKTERLADFALQYDYFLSNPRILKHLFNEALKQSVSREVAFTTRDIKKGNMITSMMYEPRVSRSKKGIPYSQTRLILSRTACKSIKKGAMLQWDSFFGVYQEVGRKGDL